MRTKRKPTVKELARNEEMLAEWVEGAAVGQIAKRHRVRSQTVKRVIEREGIERGMSGVEMRMLNELLRGQSHRRIALRYGMTALAMRALAEAHGIKRGKYRKPRRYGKVEPRLAIHIRLAPKLWERVKEEATRRGVTLTQVIEEALEAALGMRGAKEA